MKLRFWKVKQFVTVSDHIGIQTIRTFLQPCAYGWTIMVYPYGLNILAIARIRNQNDFILKKENILTMFHIMH